MSEAGTLPDCKAALEGVGKNPAQAGRSYDVYKRACGLKAQLLGCGAFKSPAVTDADRGTMDLLTLCEAGEPEACEDVKTKNAPLQAWLSTLKTAGCKKGHTGLCASYRDCKKPSKWGCSAVSGGPADQQVCGCIPKCDAQVTAAAKTRKWPDGSTRGAFVCGSAATKPGT